jgi:small subunit ribosomal protein S6
MRNYEIMYIVKPTLASEDVKKVVENFKNIIANNGGNITNFKDMGQKELAYEVKDFKSGFYFVLNIEAKDDKAIKEFDRLALISQDIIRHLITKLDN